MHSWGGGVQLCVCGTTGACGVRGAGESRRLAGTSVQSAECGSSITAVATGVRYRLHLLERERDEGFRALYWALLRTRAFAVGALLAHKHELRHTKREQTRRCERPTVDEIVMRSSMSPLLRAKGLLTLARCSGDNTRALREREGAPQSPTRPREFCRSLRTAPRRSCPSSGLGHHLRDKDHV